MSVPIEVGCVVLDMAGNTLYTTETGDSHADLDQMPGIHRRGMQAHFQMLDATTMQVTHTLRPGFILKRDVECFGSTVDKLPSETDEVFKLPDELFSFALQAFGPGAAFFLHYIIPKTDFDSREIPVLLVDQSSVSDSDSDSDIEYTTLDQAMLESPGGRLKITRAPPSRNLAEVYLMKDVSETNALAPTEIIKSARLNSQPRQVGRFGHTYVIPKFVENARAEGWMNSDFNPSSCKRCGRHTTKIGTSLLEWPHPSSCQTCRLARIARVDARQTGSYPTDIIPENFMIHCASCEVPIYHDCDDDPNIRAQDDGFIFCADCSFECGNFTGA